VFRDRPIELAEQLAQNVREFCEEKRVFVTVDVKSNKVMLTHDQKVLPIEALGKKSVDTIEPDGWRIDEKIMTEDQMLDVVLAFVAAAKSFAERPTRGRTATGGRGVMRSMA
jgi:hypothetical protein